MNTSRCAVFGARSCPCVIPIDFSPRNVYRTNANGFNLVHAVCSRCIRRAIKSRTEVHTGTLRSSYYNVLIRLSTAEK